MLLIVQQELYINGQLFYHKVPNPKVSPGKSSY